MKQWNVVQAAYEHIPAGSDARLAGEAAALLLGIRALLAAIEQRLNSGASMEQESASAEVLLGLADKSVMKAALSAGSGAVKPAALFPASPDIASVSLDQDYESFCERKDRPHSSGTFLVSLFDRSPRYVPEMQLHDPKLRKLWGELVDWFKANGSGKRYEGMHFERYVEKLHNLPPEFLAAVKLSGHLILNEKGGVVSLSNIMELRADAREQLVCADALSSLLGEVGYLKAVLIGAGRAAQEELQERRIGAETSSN